MSERQVQIRDPKYGPVEFTALTCEECQTQVQKALVVGWFKLSPNSTMDVRVIGMSPDPIDFCSLACLGKGVKAMTGE